MSLKQLFLFFFYCTRKISLRAYRYFYFFVTFLFVSMHGSKHKQRSEEFFSSFGILYVSTTLGLILMAKLEKGEKEKKRLGWNRTWNDIITATENIRRFIGEIFESCFDHRSSLAHQWPMTPRTHHRLNLLITAKE